MTPRLRRQYHAEKPPGLQRVPRPGQRDDRAGIGSKRHDKEQHHRPHLLRPAAGWHRGVEPGRAEDRQPCQYAGVYQCQHREQHFHGGEIRLSSRTGRRQNSVPRRKADCNSCHTDAVHAFGGKNLRSTTTSSTTHRPRSCSSRHVNGQLHKLRNRRQLSRFSRLLRLLSAARATQETGLSRLIRRTQAWASRAPDFPSDARVQFDRQLRSARQQAMPTWTRTVAASVRRRLTYQYNVWTNDGGAEQRPCGTGDVVIRLAARRPPR